MKQWQQELKGEAATQALGERLADFCNSPLVMGLRGDLGAGKTTLCRSLLHALGVKGMIKSPTYTLVEPYQVGEFEIAHFDLYRLANAEELEYIGIADYCDTKHLLLIEWPERGAGYLPAMDLHCHLERVQAAARQITITAQSPKGESILTAMAKHADQS